MDTSESARAFAALGHEARLDVFRLLVRAGHEELSVGDIAAHTGQPLSTLAHHLRMLVQAGLVVQRREGRTVLNRADFDATRQVAAFLTEECCTGVVLAELSESAAG